MVAIEKGLAFVMFPLSLVIILEELAIFSLPFIIDKILIGSVLMIILQLISLARQNAHDSKFTEMHAFSFVALIIPSLLYIASLFIRLNFEESIPLIIGVMMFVESMYALH